MGLFGSLSFIILIHSLFQLLGSENDPRAAIGDFPVTVQITGRACYNTVRVVIRTRKTELKPQRIDTFSFGALKATFDILNW